MNYYFGLYDTIVQSIAHYGATMRIFLDCLDMKSCVDICSHMHPRHQLMLKWDFYHLHHWTEMGHLGPEKSFKWLFDVRFWPQWITLLAPGSHQGPWEMIGLEVFYWLRWKTRMKQTQDSYIWDENHNIIWWSPWRVSWGQKPCALAFQSDHCNPTLARINQECLIGLIRLQKSDQLMSW